MAQTCYLRRVRHTETQLTNYVSVLGLITLNWCVFPTEIQLLTLLGIAIRVVARTTYLSQRSKQSCGLTHSIYLIKGNVHK